ncbi:MFS transporter [Rubrobacter calidifluminis]|uniref:MFS transporter n=1 Tax=Rubrobacter calidifluminis TaxID=1392640 RepID=UPI003B5B56C7
MVAGNQTQNASLKDTFSFEWYRSLGEKGRPAFWASFGGWAFDGFDYQILSLALSGIAATFALSGGQTGLIATVSLVVSALGGVLAGLLADRIGRVRTLVLAIAFYCGGTFLSGLSPNYEALLFFRALQGLGFGGEWAAGALLVSEMADPAQRGRVLGWVQSAWAPGWAGAVVAFTVVFSLLPQDVAWRVLFWIGIVPALFILYVLRKVDEPEVYLKTRRAREARSREAVESGATRSPLVQIFRRDLIGRTAAASLLAIGAQGGYYSIFTWLPSYLEKARGLNAVGTGSYLATVIIGSFLGYVISGYLHDLIGRRKTFALYAVLSAVLLVGYTRIPEGANGLLVVLGLPLGFFASGIYSGFGSYLAELFPSRARGAGQGFVYNFGRAVGGFFPLVIGILAAKVGLAAIALGAVGYAACVIALLLLPETRGKRFVPIN